MKVENKNSADLTTKISEAIKQINDGYSKLSKLEPIKNYRENKLWKRITIFLSIISGLLVYQQYINNTIKSRTDNLDQIFLFSINSIESKSSAVQATGINNLHTVAFKPTVVESNGTMFSPFINLWNVFAGKKEYKYLERAKNSFQIFAQTPREVVNVSINPVSSALIKTAVSWQDKEEELFGKNKNGTEAWLLYKAKLNKAYCPNINLSDQWFFDATFKQSYLNAAKFNGSYLEKAVFSSSDLSAANFSGAILNNAKIDSCKINYGIFDNIQGVKTDFSNSKLEQAKFRNSNLRSSNFDGAIILGANFSGADLTGSSFKGCNFTNVDLDGAIIKGVELSEINLEGVINFDKTIK